MVSRIESEWQESVLLKVRPDRKIERNCSALTIKSYGEDLASILEYFRDFAGGIPAVGAVTVADLRGYVAYMHACAYSRSTMARRLACLRSFFRYCCREKLAATNPASSRCFISS